MAKSFSNTGSYNLGNNTATELLLAPFEGAAVFWNARGGIDTTRKYGSDDRSVLHFFHRLCSVRELSSGTGEAQNERDAREAGKQTVTINDGVTFTQTLTLKGDDVMTMAALQGINLHNTAADTFNFTAGIRYGGTFTDAGDLVIASFDEGGAEGNVVGGLVVPNCTLKFEEIRGIADPESNVNVTIESTTAPYHFGNGVIPVPFCFYDDGTITNTAAPDGIITAFAIKDANEAYGEASTPAGDLSLQIVDPDQTGIGKYVIGLRLNGSEVTSGVTVSPGTGTLTWGSAPADGAKITGIVAVATGFPTYDSSYTYSTGSVVEWNGAYYVANTTPTGDPSADALSWDAKVLVDPPYWSTTADGTSINASTHPQHPGWSWLDFNFFG